jgi:hypothetical protein
LEQTRRKTDTFFLSSDGHVVKIDLFSFLPSVTEKARSEFMILFWKQPKAIASEQSAT